MATCHAAGVEYALLKCPFLHSVSQSNGEEFARRVALQPFQSAANRPIFEEEGFNIEATVRLFHGNGGIVPLERFARQGCCPYSRGASTNESSSTLSDTLTGATEQPARAVAASARVISRAVHPLATSTASISLSGFSFLPGPDGFLRKLRQRRKQLESKKQNVNKNKPPTNPPSSSTTATSSQTIQTSQPSVPSQGRCPLRKFVEPLGGLIPLSAAGKLQCPSVIIKARSALAKTKAIRELRPKALPIKMLSIGAVTTAVNLPCGAWREHVEKFSPAWFVAVHASIPFIAMLRKAVLMPKWAMLMTISAAVVGQVAGSRLERLRLQCQTQDSDVAHLVRSPFSCRPGSAEAALEAAHVPQVQQQVHWQPLAMATAPAVPAH